MGGVRVREIVFFLMRFFLALRLLQSEERTKCDKDNLWFEESKI